MPCRIYACMKLPRWIARMCNAKKGKADALRKPKGRKQNLERIVLEIKKKARQALGISYEFTLEELKDELKERRFPKAGAREMVSILSAWEDMEYKEKTLTEKEKESILKSSEMVLAQLDKLRNRRLR